MLSIIDERKSLNIAMPPGLSISGISCILLKHLAPNYTKLTKIQIITLNFLEAGVVVLNLSRLELSWKSE